jgi:raffinose/stachyose/melibiose transport system substrate-binding protein
MKQRVLLALVLILVFSATSTLAQEDQVTLTVWHQFVDEDLEAWEPVKAAFEAANPNITIEDTAFNFEDLLDALTVALPAGEGPDVFYLDASSAFLGNLVESDLVVDLSPYLDERGWDAMFPWALEKTSVGGVPYGVGGFTEIIGLYYRADLFEEMGLDAPTSWDAMTAAADRAVEEGMIAFNFGGLEGWPIGQLCGTIMHSMVAIDTIGDIELLEGESTYNDHPQTVDALAECQSWITERGWLPDDAVAVSYFDAQNDFANGEGLMRVDGTWAVPAYEDSEFDIEFAVFPMKDTELAPQAEGGLSSTWIISNQTTELDAVLDFLDFVVFSDEANTVWMNNGFIPAVNFDTSGVEASPLLVANLEGIDYVSTEGNGLGFWVFFITDPAVTDEALNGLGGLMLNAVDAEQLADTLSAAIELAREDRQ